MRDTHGLITQDYWQRGERFEIVHIGNYTHAHEDTFLLRVSTANLFRLRLHFFDGNSGEYKSDTHDIKTIETAVRLLPDENTIFIHDAIPNTGNQTSFDIDCTDRFFVRGEQNSSDIIDDKPVRVFAILTDSSDQPRGIDDHLYEDRIAIENACRKHKMRAAWFTIEPNASN